MVEDCLKIGKKVFVKNKKDIVKSILYRCIDYGLDNNNFSKLEAVFKIIPYKLYKIVDRCKNCRQLWINVSGQKLMLHDTDVYEESMLRHLKPRGK